MFQMKLLLLGYKGNRFETKRIEHISDPGLFIKTFIIFLVRPSEAVWIQESPSSYKGNVYFSIHHCCFKL